MQYLAAKKKQIRLLLVISLTVGILGIVLSALLASYAFLIFSLPNLSLAIFFSYKYITYDKSIRNYNEHKRSRKRH